MEQELKVLKIRKTSNSNQLVTNLLEKAKQETNPRQKEKQLHIAHQLASIDLAQELEQILNSSRVLPNPSGHIFSKIYACIQKISETINYLGTSKNNDKKNQKLIKQAKDLLQSSVNIANSPNTEELENEELIKASPNVDDLQLETQKLTNLKIRNLIERLGVYNWGLYLSIGYTQLGIGTVAVLTILQTSEAAHLSKKILGVASQALLIASGAIYIARGSLMLYRSCQAYNLAFRLRKNLETTFKEKTKFSKEDVDTLKEFLEKSAAFKEITDGHGTTSIIDIYTGRTKESISSMQPSELAQYLQDLDQGIHEEMVKHKTSMMIGAAMVIGGIALVVVSVYSGGTVALALNIASTALFVCMEESFLQYDSPDAMKAAAHKEYEQPSWLEKHNVKIYDLSKELFSSYKNQLNQSWIDHFSRKAPKEDPILETSLQNDTEDEISSLTPLILDSNVTKKLPHRIALKWSEYLKKEIHWDPLILHRKYIEEENQDLESSAAIQDADK